MNTIENCPICHSTEHTLFFTGKDYSFTQEEFSIVSCQSCGFKFTNPIPTEDKIGEYYKAENYISHTSSKKGLFERIYHLVRKRAIKNKLKLVSDYSSGKDLLDFGCGTGDFLHFASEQGWNAQGMEPSEDARKIAEEKGITVHSTESLNQLKENSLDAISMWHVLEHVYHLNKDFDQLKKALRSGGYFFIAVPNCQSYDANHYGKFWAAWDLPIHLYHFTPKDIQNFAKEHELTYVKTTPMKFDSFYVSMLSEKYRSSKEKVGLGHMIKGFFRGWISNMKANKEQYSSQIYVLKKP